MDSGAHPTEEQAELRREGLRMPAQIIARPYLRHPRQYKRSDGPRDLISDTTLQHAERRAAEIIHQ